MSVSIFYAHNQWFFIFVSIPQSSQRLTQRTPLSVPCAALYVLCGSEVLGLSIKNASINGSKSVTSLKLSNPLFRRIV